MDMFSSIDLLSKPNFLYYINDLLSMDAVSFTSLCLCPKFRNHSTRMYHSFAFAVTIFYQLLFIESSYSMFDFNNASNNTMNECIIRNELYWKVLPWFYGPLTYVDIFAISLPNAPQPIKHLSNMFLSAITDSKFFLFGLHLI